MTKKTNHKKEEEKICKQLSEIQRGYLAQLIINATKCTDVSQGMNSRKKRKLPPAGTIMIF